MLTIFGNLWIDNKSKLKHMQDSLCSFAEISDNWVVNVRGRQSKPAIKFLKKVLGDNLRLYNLQDETRGWSNNALEMCESIRHKYVLLWNEDHINIAPQHIYKSLIKEIIAESVDSMWYSWWHFRKSRKRYDKLKLRKLRHIDTVTLTRSKWKIVNQNNPFYIVTMMSIFKKSFFIKLLVQESKMFPFAYTQKLLSFLDRLIDKGIGRTRTELYLKINWILGYKFRNFPEYTPFNLEKEQYRDDILPLKVALPKKELFVCIEDDQYEPNYSLISRGQYKSQERVRNKG